VEGLEARGVLHQCFREEEALSQVIVTRWFLVLSGDSAETPSSYDSPFSQLKQRI
jgi:hypothetical protein